MLLALSYVTYVFIGWFKCLLLKFLYEYWPCGLCSTVLDAWGKPGAGIMQGRTKFPGSYDECLSTALSAYNREIKAMQDFSGKYCRLQIPTSIINLVVLFLKILKMLGLYLDTFIISHKFGSMLSNYTKWIKIVKGIAKFHDNNVFWTKQKKHINKTKKQTNHCQTWESNLGPLVT